MNSSLAHIPALVAATLLVACQSDPEATGATDGTSDSTTMPTTSASTGTEASQDTNTTGVASSEGVDTGSSAGGDDPDGTADASTSSPGTDASTSSADTGEPEMATLSNTPTVASCAQPMVVWASIPQESNHLMATKLTPSAYPFTVHSIGYDLSPSLPQCGSHDHDVLVLVSSEATPGATPSADMTLVDTLHVPLLDGTAGAFEVELTEPIVLEEGEVLYVAIQMAVEGDATLCIGACSDSPALEGVDFWSGSSSEPYPWIEWTQYVGPVNNLTTRAFGYGP